ncbi:MAG: CHASE2 domain-containing protein, partial [Nitrospinaceae bacterium]|nr:CHASE2 domain-containing protein [Nitrospinaceae bacterium]NIR57972.1 CHASE2 domain-containing protein [Nitrospinaceae bacterium]NIS88435.1 CHASE2 domain-containing protein [Nitrospinaceae bacterium]NIT85310.1 CHASE2 domain-containing protein [Nitrospinaceae bacterium]NIU47466.1 CHASE2 domain-containing protein [Nitrospinaceae bacterium]
WPWPRTKLARLTDRLSDAGAAVIGFDIFFPEKDAYVPFTVVKQAIRTKENVEDLDRERLVRWLEEVSDSDRQFAEALERSRRSVLAFFVYPREDPSGA